MKKFNIVLSLPFALVTLSFFSGTQSNAQQVNATFQNVYNPINTLTSTRLIGVSQRKFVGEFTINRDIPSSGTQCFITSSCVAKSIGFSVNNFLSNMYGVRLEDATTTFKNIKNLTLEVDYYINNILKDTTKVTFDSTDKNATIFGRANFDPRVLRDLNIGVHRLVVYAYSIDTEFNPSESSYWRTITSILPYLGYTKPSSVAGYNLNYLRLKTAVPTKYISANRRILAPLLVDQRYGLNKATYQMVSLPLGPTEVSHFVVTNARRVIPVFYPDSSVYTLQFTPNYSDYYYSTAQELFSVDSFTSKGASANVGITVPDGRRANYTATVQAVDWSGVISYQTIVGFKVNAMVAPVYSQNSLTYISRKCGADTFSLKVKRPLTYFDSINSSINPADFFGYLVYLENSNHPQTPAAHGFKVPLSNVITANNLDTIQITNTRTSIGVGNYRLHVCGFGTNGIEGHCAIIPFYMPLYCN